MNIHILKYIHTCLCVCVCVCTCVFVYMYVQVCVCVCVSATVFLPKHMTYHAYGVATISRLLQILGLFCRIQSLF